MKYSKDLAVIRNFMFEKFEIIWYIVISFTKHAFKSFFILFVFMTASVYAQQRMENFYISNIKEDGTKDWDVRGKEAMIYDKYVDIDEMKANYYSENDLVIMTSQKARLDKQNMNIYLKDNVQIENKEGITLLTDSLNWEREKNLVATDDWVKTSKDSMQITAEGLSADTKFEEIDFEKNVEALLPDKNNQNVTTITCSGPLEIEYKAGEAVFNEDVVAINPQVKLYSDKATLFFDTVNKEIIKIVSEGNVKIVQDSNISFSQKATYLNNEQKVILEGKPRLIYLVDEDSGPILR